MKNRKALSIMLMVVLLCFSSMAYAEWNFGIGTGPQIIGVDGDVVFGTAKLDMNSSSSDIGDIGQNMLGLTGYATDGKWIIKYQIGQLTLGESGSIGTVGGLPFYADSEFDILSAEVTGGIYVYDRSFLKVNTYFGFRFVKHKMDLVLSGNITGQGEIEDSWGDGLFGLGFEFPFNDKFSLDVQADVAFGKSEGGIRGYTGIKYNFYGDLSATFFGRYNKVDYHSGNPASPNYYEYDANETSAGVIVMYNF